MSLLPTIYLQVLVLWNDSEGKSWKGTAWHSLGNGNFVRPTGKGRKFTVKKYSKKGPKKGFKPIIKGIF